MRAAYKPPSIFLIDDALDTISINTQRRRSLRCCPGLRIEFRSASIGLERGQVQGMRVALQQLRICASADPAAFIFNVQIAANASMNAKQRNPGRKTAAQLRMTHRHL
jgi:hypothetical protein